LIAGALGQFLLNSAMVTVVRHGTSLSENWRYIAAEKKSSVGCLLDPKPLLIGIASWIEKKRRKGALGTSIS
jgi:hypothetical protein